MREHALFTNVNVIKLVFLPKSSKNLFFSDAFSLHPHPHLLTHARVEGSHASCFFLPSCTGTLAVTSWPRADNLGLIPRNEIVRDSFAGESLLDDRVDAAFILHDGETACTHAGVTNTTATVCGLQEWPQGMPWVPDGNPTASGDQRVNEARTLVPPPRHAEVVTSQMRALFRALLAARSAGESCPRVIHVEGTPAWGATHSALNGLRWEVHEPSVEQCQSIGFSMNGDHGNRRLSFGGRTGGVRFARSPGPEPPWIILTSGNVCLHARQTGSNATCPHFPLLCNVQTDVRLLLLLSFPASSAHMHTRVHEGSMLQVCNAHTNHTHVHEGTVTHAPLSI